MGRSRGHQLGGITGLTAALEDPEFEQAIEYDLIKVGLRLRWLCDGTDRLNWRDLMVIVREAGRESAIVRSAYGELVEWGVGEHLLAGVLDALNGANYQRGGGKGPKPKPIERPADRTSGGAEQSAAQQASPGAGSSQMFSSDGFEMDSLTIEEMDEWLGLKPVPS